MNKGLALLTALCMVPLCQADPLGFETGEAQWVDFNQGSSELDASEQNWIRLDNAEINRGVPENQAAWFTLPQKGMRPALKVQEFDFLLKPQGGYGAQSYDAIADQRLAIEQTDVKFYYDLGDNWMNFDAGFNLRNLDGNLYSLNETHSINEVLPMFFLKGSWNLPLTGFVFEADMNHLDSGGSKGQDFSATIQYQNTQGFNALLGYRLQTLRLENQRGVNEIPDLDYDGVYVGAYYHF